MLHYSNWRDWQASNINNLRMKVPLGSLHGILSLRNRICQESFNNNIHKEKARMSCS